MSVVGIDFGNENCYISVARAGGIESIANDYSMRDTPSYVAFGEKQRLLGVAAKNQHLTNLKKTFFGFKPLIGRKFKDPIVQQELTRLPYPISEDPQNGNILIHVDYMGKSQSFTPSQVAAMLFTKLKEIAENALQTKVKDVVISVPIYYTDSERRCMLDAATMADLNVLKLMNDTTATALAYGIYKQDLPPPEEKARNVIFVDVGHRSTQAAACSFNKGKLNVAACSFDPTVGGRNFNENVARYFAEDFKKNFKIDVYSKPKAVLKLITEIEKLKKQMSANTNKLPINIECFMDDKDVKGYIDRATFEEISTNEMNRIRKVLEDCLSFSKWKKEDIYSVEIVGGSTRVPMIKNIIEQIYGKTPNTTLNADEAVSRGCALQCAILSPTFKVREFSVSDVQPYPIRLRWKAEGDDGEMEVFSRFNVIPFSKMLTFYRSSNFTLSAEYADTGIILDPHIGNFEIMEVKPQPDGSNQKVKVKVRVNLNGVFTVVTASLSEKHEVEEEVPMEVVEDEASKNENTDAGASSTTSSSNTAAATGGGESGMKESPEKKESSSSSSSSSSSTTATNTTTASSSSGASSSSTSSAPRKMEKQRKIVTKTIDLPVTCKVVGSLTYEKLSETQNLERSMSNQDKMEAERLTCKNAVEEYVYDIRSRIYDDLSDFITEDDRVKFSKDLEESENWLYEDGENVEKEVYLEKLKNLKMKGDAVKRRKEEHDERPVAVNSLGHGLQMASKVIEAYKAGDEKYEHLDSAGIDKVDKLIKEKTKWMNESVQLLNSLDKTTNPNILTSEFYSVKKGFEAIANPILNKAKPKVEPPPPPPKSDSTKDSEEKMEDSNSCEVPSENSKTSNSEEKSKDMELD